MKKRLMAGLLALVMVLMGIPVTAFAADEAEIPDPIAITENGIYQLTEDETGVLTVAAGVTELTIEGSGKTNEISIDCTAAPGIHLTLRDTALSTDSGSLLRFSGAANVLRTEGVCLLDSADAEAALIHTEGDLTFEGDGALYLYAAQLTDGEAFAVTGCTISLEGGTVGGTWQLGAGSIRADWAEDAILVNPDGEQLYLYEAALPEAAEAYEVTVDDEAAYAGPGFVFRHGEDSWHEEADAALYLYLTGADHTLVVNGTEQNVYWDSLFQVFRPVKHTIASFAVTPSDAKVVVSEGIGYTYTEQTMESKTADGMTKFSLAPGSYTATITKAGYYASQFSFQVTQEQKITSIDTSSNVKNYLDENGVFTIGLGTFRKSSNAGVWDGVTLDVSWYSENASEMEIRTPAQFAGMAAICNGIYNAEITAIIDDANGDGRTETYTPEDYAALQNRKIRPACSESGTGDGNKVTTDSYWYGVKKDGTTPSDFNGQTIRITADLDMGGTGSGGSWSGARYMTIGGQSLMHYIDYAARESDGYSHIGSSFNGHLEGQGHIIKNIYCDRDASGSNYGDSSSIGLIGRLGNHDSDPDELMAVDPSVRDLAVTGYIFGRRSVGGIVGKIGRTSASDLKDGSTGGIIENCLNFCQVRNTDAKGVGGIVGAGWNEGLIRNCANFGYIYAAYKNAGGISGSCEVNVVNCYNAGYVDAVSIDYAQALATDNGGAVFTNCYWLTGSCFADSDDSYSYPAVYKNDSKDTITEVTSFAAMAGDAFLADLNGDGRDWTTAAASDGISQLLAATGFENCKLSTSGVTAEGFPVPRVFVSDVVSITGIEKISDPEKLSYVAGESFDTTGLQIQATYSDGTTELLTDYTVTPGGALTVSDTVVTVSGERGGMSYRYEFAITVTDRAVSEIRIQTTPTNTIYAADEQIDLSGMVVAAYYTDAPDTAVILNEEEYTTSISGDVLKVSYTFSGKTVTTSMTFTRLSAAAPKENQGYYELSCADHLTWFANQVTNVKNTAISGRVTADITADELFMGIGKSGAYFAGVFDGQDHTITLNMSTAGTAGLFTGVSGGQVCNVVVAGTVRSTSNTSGVAGVVAYVGTGGATITDCVNEAEVTGGGYAGGIVGKTASTSTNILSCENQGSITASASYAGGIAGNVAGTAAISDCMNNGSVSGAGDVGGILGHAGSVSQSEYVSIAECGNNGAVSGTTAVGGILGSCDSEFDEILCCYNAASVRGTKLESNSGAGGIAGSFAGTMDSCYNCGNISGTASAQNGTGGLVGLAYECVIRNTYNSGSASNAIIGYVYYGTTNVTNTYYLEGTNAIGSAAGSNAVVSGDYAAKTSTELMALAQTLGSNFKSNGDTGYHGGYPVLVWEDAEHVHSWDAGSVTTAATCTADGVMTYTCICGKTRTEVIEATGHSWDEGAVTKEPTCTEAGEKTISCTNGCGETQTETIAAIGHNWDEGRITTEATCTEAGETTYTCANCGETNVEAIEATGHAWDDGTVTREPTETEAGERTYTCGNCGEIRTESIDPVGHTWDEGTITREPTCTDPGERTYHCTDEVCEITKTEEIAALGHAWDEGTITKEPTCTEAGVMTITCTNGCGETQIQEIDALGHAWDEGATTKEPTCTEAGEMTITCTNGCGETQIQEIDALGHAWDEGATTKEPTCTEAGVMTITCTNGCGETQTEEIAALGHAWDEGAITRDPTCTEMGEKTYTCAHCGGTKAERIGTGAHQYVSTVTEPGCTDPGHTTHTCTVCGDSYTDGETAALGHSWDQGQITAEPSCTHGGEKTFRCIRCGAARTENTSAAGHRWDSGRVTRSASCTTPGVMTYTCACGSTRTAVIPALGHALGSRTVTRAATCTEDGTQQAACTRSGCGHTETKRISALGHDFADGICTRCSETLTEATEAVHEHVWDEGTVTREPTCTEAGEQTYTCTDCGDTRTEEIAKTGHRFEDGVCTNCGETEATQPEPPADEDPVISSGTIVFIVMIVVIALLLNRLKIFK